MTRAGAAKQPDHQLIALSCFEADGSGHDFVSQYTFPALFVTVLTNRLGGAGTGNGLF
jgi:hypothetical protein